MLQPTVTLMMKEVGNYLYVPNKLRYDEEKQDLSHYQFLKEKSSQILMS